MAEVRGQKTEVRKQKIDVRQLATSFWQQQPGTSYFRPKLKSKAVESKVALSVVSG